MVKNPPANAGDLRDADSIPGLGRSPGGGRGNSLQCSCLENPMDRGAWRATAQGAAQDSDRLSTHTWKALPGQKFFKPPALCIPSVQFSSVTQSCPTLCDPIDGSPPGSSVPGIPQARVLEWVVIAFSKSRVA